jgi:hypothetical protein
MEQTLQEAFRQIGLLWAQIQVLANAINDARMQALNDLNTFAVNHINWITGKLDDIEDEFGNVRNDYINRINSTVTLIGNTSSSTLTSAKDYTDDKVANLRNFTINEIGRIDGGLAFLSNELRQEIDDAKDFVMSFISSSIIPRIDNINLLIADIQDFIDNATCIVNALTNDPVGFLIELFDHFLLDWLQYAIAEKFGLSEGSLPDRPNFFKRIC